MNIISNLFLIVFFLFSAVFSYASIRFAIAPPGMGHTGMEIWAPLIFLFLDVCVLGFVWILAKRLKIKAKMIYIVGGISGVIYILSALISS
jgi:hypothetical protein